jgi:hypothetical protein
MAGPPIGFTEVTLNFSGSGLNYNAATSFGFDEPSGNGQVAADFLALIFGALHDAISVTTVTLTSLDLKYGPEGTGPTFSSVIGTPGSVSNDSCGPSVAYLIRKPVANVSQRFAGRSYWPGVPATYVDEGGDILDSDREDVQDEINAKWDDIEGVAGLVGYVFPADGGSPRIHGTPLLQGRVATQRRRLRR